MVQHEKEQNKRKNVIIVAMKLIIKEGFSKLKFKFLKHLLSKKVSFFPLEIYIVQIDTLFE